MKKLTYIMENYLEAIYRLASDGKGARVTDIAQSLGVTKASTNSAMAALAEKGLINYEKYKEIFLTTEGLRLAEMTSKKHTIIQQFFTDILNVDAGIADTDACAIEHVISNDSVYAMHYYLHNAKEGKTDI